jgi:DNA-binding transcriptional LysR family regulator
MTPSSNQQFPEEHGLLWSYRLSVNNGEFLAAVASFGQALVTGPVAFLQSYIDRGALVPILTEFERPEVGMYAVYPPGRLVATRVRVLSDALYEYFQGRWI